MTKFVVLMDSFGFSDLNNCFDNHSFLNWYLFQFHHVSPNYTNDQWVYWIELNNEMLHIIFEIKLNNTILMRLLMKFPHLLFNIQIKHIK